MVETKIFTESPRGFHITYGMSDNKAENEESQFKFTLVNESKLPPFTDHFPCYEEGLMRCEQNGFTLSAEFVRNLGEFRDFQLREDDVWVITFPKCGSYLFDFTKIRPTQSKLNHVNIFHLGTTWTQELVWMIVNNCDFETSSKIPLTYRSPFLE